MTTLIEKLATWREELLSDNISCERERNLLLMSVNHHEAQIQLNSRNINDIDRAIAALEPAPYTAEDFDTITIFEGPELTQDVIDALEDEPDDTSEFSESETQTEQASTSDDANHIEGASEGQSVPGTGEESRDQFEEEAERAAAIELTADVEPTEGYAHVTDAWVETTPGTLAEYTSATNPEADALAKAHDWYSPEKVAERERADQAWAGLGNLWGRKPKVDA